MITAGLFYAGYLLAVWHWSIRFTSVANSTLLANFAPVFVVLYGWVALDQRVTGRFVLAMLVALAGTTLLVARDLNLDPRALCGDLLGLVTAVFYAGYLLSIKNLRGRFATVDVMARSGLVTGVALLPVALVSRETLLPHTAHGWMILGALALVSHIGGQSLIAFALAKLPTALASVSLLVQPVTATLAAAFLLKHEQVAPWQIVGMVLVLAWGVRGPAGSALVARRELERHPSCRVAHRALVPRLITRRDRSEISLFPPRLDHAGSLVAGSLQTLLRLRHFRRIEPQGDHPPVHPVLLQVMERRQPVFDLITVEPRM